MIVGVFGDAWDWVKGRAEDAGDLVSDAFDAIPGSELLKDFWNGPLRDFAKTDVGKIVLRAVATAAQGPIAPIVGSQLSSIVWAVPGLFRGERIDQAWISEFGWRLKTTAEILGPQVAEALGAQVDAAIEALKASPDAAASMAGELAEQLGVSDWAADQARSLVLGLEPPNPDDYEADGRSKARAANDAAAARMRALVLRDATTMRNTSAAFRLLSQSVAVRTAARSSVATVQNRSAALAYFREGRAAPSSSPTLDRAAGAASVPTTRPRNGLASDVALGLLVAGAVGAVIWWHRAESR